MDTGIQEMAIPGAVTTTIQRVEHLRGTDGRSHRTITWLGKSAVEVAESGSQFYVSQAGRDRGAIEVAEARYNEQNISPGWARLFISPRMTGHDAPKAVAEADNVYDEDAVRVSYAMTDAYGQVVARRIESLLVSDIPFEAWTAMLADERNMFGKAFDVADSTSALDVMGLFDKLSVNETLLPEGPVTIVESVLPYITDRFTRQQVESQVAKFRSGQDKYREESAKTAAEWLQFDLELARSLEAGEGNIEIQSFITGLQHQWGAKDLAVILQHDVAGKYIMTEQLAALLEKAKRNLLASQTALAVGNEKVLAQTDAATAKKLQNEIGRIEAMELRGVHPEQIAFARAQFMRLVARQNFRVGGGCAGTTNGSFNGKRGGSGNSGSGSGEAGLDDDDQEESADSWTWKKGVCRVEKCPSPQPTEVGPCSVCRNCQHKFDIGLDPTSGDAPVAVKSEKEQFGDLWKGILESIRSSKSGRNPDPKAVLLGV